MLIFKNLLIRILKSPVKLICFFVLPFLFLGLFVLEGQYLGVNVAIIDKDQTALSEYIQDEIGESFNIVNVDEDQLDNYLLNDYIDYVLIIDAGFEEKTIAGEVVHLKEQYISESGKTYPIKAKVQTVIQSINTLLSDVTSSDELMDRVNALNEGNFVISKKLIEIGSIQRAISVTGMLLQFMFIMSMVSSSIILQERRQNILKRTLIAPITQKQYIIESLLSLLTIAFIQVIIFYGGIKVMGISVGNDLLYFITLVVASVTNLCFGLFIVSFCKNEIQAYWIAMCTSTPLAMIGGYYFPIDMMPNVLQKISLFTPMRWIVDTTTAIIEKQSLSEFVTNYIVIIAFAFAFLILTLSTRKKFLRI